VKTHELRIERIVEETADARSLALEVPVALAPRFAYRAGQFLTFEVPWGGARLLRCYSLSSCPDSEREHKVTVKRVERGRVSNWFHELREGDLLQVMPPAGRFVLRESERPLLMWGGGSGITPLMSLIKSALATTERSIHLLFANRDPASVIFRGELDALVERYPQRLSVEHHLDSERGFLEVPATRVHLAGQRSAHSYICGPTPFMDLVESVLAEAGFGSDRIFIERFSSPQDGELPEVLSSHELTREDDVGVVPEVLVVHLDGATHQVPYKAGQSILSAVRAAGLDPPYACEQGHCGSCAAKKIRGEVVMAVNDVFEEDEVAEGHVLTCQGLPVGPVCEVRYED